MITALYTFRSFFMTFHGKPRMDDETYSHVHESPASVLIPLILLAIPSVILGYILYMPMLFSKPSLLNASLFVLPDHNVLAELGKEVVSPLHSMFEAPCSPVFWLTLTGIFLAWVCYIVRPSIPAFFAKHFHRIYQLLLAKYGFDAINDLVFVKGVKGLGRVFYKVGDQRFIDGFFVNGTGHAVRWLSTKGRAIQSGYLYHYIAAMVFGVLGFLCWLLL